MRHPFLNLLVRWAILAIGVVIATKLIPGISYDDPWTLCVAVLLLSFCNAVLRPILMLFALPFIIISMGLGILLINALLFLLVSKLVDGFHVSSFWSALGGSLIVSLTTMVLSFVLKKQKVATSQAEPPPRQDRKNQDVIDI
jgi:putative membrane protein